MRCDTGQIKPVCFAGVGSAGSGSGGSEMKGGAGVVPRGGAGP